MDAPARPLPLRSRTKYAVGVGLFVTGLVAETLDAFAFASYTKEVMIGQTYQLIGMYTLDLDCSGCEHSYDKSDRPIYLDVFFTPEGGKPMLLTLKSNAIFVPPATGRLHDPRVNISDLPIELRQEAERRGCAITGGRLSGNPFPPN